MSIQINQNAIEHGLQLGVAKAINCWLAVVLRRASFVHCLFNLLYYVF